MNGTRGLVIAVGVAFIAGCAAGLVGGMVAVRLLGPGVGPFARHGPPFGPRGPHRDQRMLDYLTQEVHLSAAQRVRVEVLMQRARSRHEAIRDSMQVWLDHELTPEQRARWKELERTMGLRRHGDRDRPPRPPDRP